VYHDDCNGSLGSVAEKQWPNTLYRLLSAPLLQRPSDERRERTYIDVVLEERWWIRRRRRRVVLSHPAPRTFDEEDSGLLVRCTNRLVWNHRIVRGGATMTRVRITRLYEDFIFTRFINQVKSISINWLSIQKIRLDTCEKFKRKCFHCDLHFLFILKFYPQVTHEVLKRPR